MICHKPLAECLICKWCIHGQLWGLIARLRELAKEEAKIKRLNKMILSVFFVLIFMPSISFSEDLELIPPKCFRLEAERMDICISSHTGIVRMPNEWANFGYGNYYPICKQAEIRRTFWILEPKEVPCEEIQKGE